MLKSCKDVTGEQTCLYIVSRIVLTGGGSVDASQANQSRKAPGYSARFGLPRCPPPGASLPTQTVFIPDFFLHAKFSGAQGSPVSTVLHLVLRIIRYILRCMLFESVSPTSPNARALSVRKLC